MKKLLLLLCVIAIIGGAYLAVDNFFHFGNPLDFLNQLMNRGEETEDEPQGVPNDPATTQKGYNEEETPHTHSFGYWELMESASCTEDGYEERFCECGEYEIRTVYATGHSFGSWSTTINPTCTENGEEASYCYCGEAQYRTVYATGHSFGSWSMFTYPTCTENGEEASYCYCGEAQFRTVYATGHSYGPWSVSQYSTCTEDGEEVRYCNCGDAQTRVVPAGQHYPSEWITDIPASCTVTGLRHKECSACGDILETEELSILPHTQGAYITTKEATCTENGMSESVCTVCGILLDARTIYSSGHSYSSTAIPPSCEKPGEIIFTCSKCTDSYKEKGDKALGHDIGLAGKCSRCDADFSVDIKSKISAPLEDAPYGFTFFTPNNNNLFIGAEAKNLSGKIIRRFWFQVIAYNSDGEAILVETIEKSLPVNPGENLIFTMAGKLADAIKSSTVDLKLVAKVEIASVKIEYADGTVEGGSYGYSTTKLSGKLWH